MSVLSMDWRLVVAITTVLVVAGCGTTRMYEGEERSKERVATIKPGGTFLVRGISIVGVDDVAPGFFAKNVEVLPGNHKVRVQLKEGDSLAWGNVSFAAAAGHVYRVEADQIATGLFSSDFFVWVEDDNTGNLVGGKKPK